VFFGEKEKKILIVRKTLPSLRISVIMLMNELIDLLDVRDFIIEEKVQLNWHYNGSLIHFGGLDDPEKVKSSDWNYIWMEEATEFTFEDFKALKLRLRSPSKDGKRNKMFLSFNPIDEFHWIKEKIVDDKTQDAFEIVSTYRDNPFLPADYVKTLEDLQFQDIAFWNIYALGKWGKLENVVYKNWDIVDWWPDCANSDNVFYGLDFGYNDPTGLLEIHKRGKEIWERELLYHTKMTNADLIVKLGSLIPPDNRRYTIYADAQEPDRIEEIKRAGFRIKAANKRIMDGIDAVKRFQCHILSDSVNVIKEKRAYSWRKNKDGNVIDEPIDFLNHLMDAERYAIHTATSGSGSVRVRFI